MDWNPGARTAGRNLIAVGLDLVAKSRRFAAKPDDDAVLRDDGPLRQELGEREGVVDGADDINRTDERDKTINRRGELIGYYVSSAGVVVVMGLTMLEYEYFWIANALYASFVLGSLVSSAVKLAAYRRGF